MTIRPFGHDLWRDIDLALEKLHEETFVEGWVENDGMDEPPTNRSPYLYHIRDRILEHRAAELRPLQSGAEHVAKIAQRGIDDALMLSG